MLLPEGSNCLLADYREDIDYVRYFKQGVLPDTCANDCLRTADCTGFEAPYSNDYCLMWLRGACSKPTSPGVAPGPSSGEGSYLTYVYIAPSLGQRFPVLFPILVVVFVGCGLGVLSLASLRLLDMCKDPGRLRASTAWHVELPVVSQLTCSESGVAEGSVQVTKKTVRLKEHIQKAVDELVREAVGKEDEEKRKATGKEEKKFAGPLTYGEARLAAIGITSAMKADDSKVKEGMAKGIKAIEEEFEALGDATASECLKYVLHEPAGKSNKIFDNSPYPRDCDSNDEYPSRVCQTRRKKLTPQDQENLGEGMKLEDFFWHPDATVLHCHSIACACPARVQPWACL